MPTEFCGILRASFSSSVNQTFFPITEVSDDELTRVSQLLKALSPNARQFQATRGQLPLRWDALMNLWDTFLEKSDNLLCYKMGAC